MKVNLRIVGLIAAPLPIFALAAPADASVTPAAAGRVVLSSEAVPAQDLAHATHTGTVASSQKLGLEVSLQPRNQAQLAAFLKAVSDPKSTSYKHYLTVAQYAAEYAPTEAQIAQVSAYLKSEGLSVGALTANHLTLAVSGTAADRKSVV